MYTTGQMTNKSRSDGDPEVDPEPIAFLPVVVDT